jgi:putative aldouronate transport system permease protein
MLDMNRSWRKMNTVDYLIYALLVPVAIVTIFPFVYVVAASFSNPSLVAANPILFYPKQFTLSTYEILLSVSTVWLGYYNSIIYTVAGTTLNVVVTLLAAYALSRHDLLGRRYVLLFIILTLFFSGGMIPLYLVVKALGILDTRWALIIPGAVTTWNLLITRAYLESNIPQELHDAAEVDGAGEFTFFAKVVLPLSKPIIAVITLFYGSGHWNAYFNALIYLRDRTLYPLQVFLREILILEQASEMLGDMGAERALFTLTLKYAIMVVAVAPLLVAFPFVQRYFVKGVLIGALKE